MTGPHHGLGGFDPTCRPRHLAEAARGGCILVARGVQLLAAAEGSRRRARAAPSGVPRHRGRIAKALGEAAGALIGIAGQLTVNGAGAFEVGGPEGDNGLSGKKLVMDAYGPRVPIGGGAWSGKDFFKADRAGGLHACRLAKFVVEHWE